MLANMSRGSQNSKFLGSRIIISAPLRARVKEKVKKPPSKNSGKNADHFLDLDHVRTMSGPRPKVDRDPVRTGSPSVSIIIRREVERPRPVPVKPEIVNDPAGAVNERSHAGTLTGSIV